MGSKNPSNREQIILSDSDCEIQEVDVSSITIPDSPEAINLTTESELENTKNISDLGDENNFLFEVNFKDVDVFKDLGQQVLDSLRKTFGIQAGFLIVDNDESIQVFRGPIEIADETLEVATVANRPEPNDDAVETVEDKPEVKDDSQSKVEEPPEEEQEEEVNMDISSLFMIDTEPAEEVNAVQIPSYKRTIKEVLSESSAKKKKKSDDDCVRPKQSKSCFNCEGTDHDLRSCPKPRNMTKINKAKKMHGKRRDRYHVDIEQRFAHLRPGQISKNLREALGIRHGELPFFVYRMRVYGYPPGWLEDAKVAHSGISLFDSEGRSVRDPEDEEGEVDVDKNKYDVNKIVGFPGFNVDPGPNFYDDFEYHNVPPLNPDDFKEELIKKIGDNVTKGYKRKKMKEVAEDEVINERPSLEPSEMEIEEDGNITNTNVEFTRPPPPPTPPPNEQSPPPPPPSPPAASPGPKTPGNRSPSPSLEDLEEKQKRLLQELQSSTILISDNDDSLIDDVLELEKASLSLTSTPTKLDLLKIDVPRSTDSICSDSPKTNGASNSPLPQTPNSAMAACTQSLLGTPLLKFSPFDKVPCGDNFKVGVSDVINFENLPDSTGAYEKMKDVIMKVRTIVTKLNSDDS